MLPCPPMPSFLHPPHVSPCYFPCSFSCFQHPLTPHTPQPPTIPPLWAHTSLIFSDCFYPFCDIYILHGTSGAPLVSTFANMEAQTIRHRTAAKCTTNGENFLRPCSNVSSRRESRHNFSNQRKPVKSMKRVSSLSLLCMGSGALASVSE